MVVALLLAAAGSWAYVASNSEASERELTNVRDEDRLIDARWSLERAGLDLLIAGMLEGFGIEDAPAERRESAADRIRVAYQTLVEVAATDGPAATRATVVVEALDDDIALSATDADLVELYWAVEAVRWADESVPAATRFDALNELGFIAALPDHILVEGLVALADVESFPIDPELTSLHEVVLDVVRVDGGWLAADPPAPLSESEWFDIENARSAFPAETAAVEELIATSELVGFDDWMREFGESTAPPPLATDELLAMVDDVRTDVVAVVDPVLDAELDAAVAELDAAIESDRRLQMAAIGLMAVAIVVAAVGVARLWAVRRATRQLSDLALRDALTGVGNRHALDETVRSALSASGLEHHVIVMVDLDRFKMVNDVYGHASGDAVLVEVSARLQRIVETIAAATPGGRGAVVRLGGDEFLLALHAAAEVPLDVVHAYLEQARSETLTLDVDGIAEVIVPDFSLGLVDCRGRGDLDELMTAADLRAYADKERRSALSSRARLTDGVIDGPTPTI
ncbi:MAG: GGDEF domain-containing protein [Ilumatobacter sp.]|uniref:GGDEF domain-containing protein n=1 Tax=Ilumatobacter sp. TaxID=1967498 RepID=UPI00391A255A